MCLDHLNTFSALSVARRSSSVARESLALLVEAEGLAFQTSSAAASQEVRSRIFLSYSLPDQGQLNYLTSESGLVLLPKRKREVTDNTGSEKKVLIWDWISRQKSWEESKDSLSHQQ